MTTDSTYSGRSKTLPRPRKSKMVLDEDVGEFKNYPVSKEQNYTTVVIGKLNQLLIKLIILSISC